LRSVGFNDVEILAVIYSYVVGDNLGWLFDLAGLGVTEERVNQGLSYAVSKRSLSLKISLTEKPPFILNSIVELKGSIYPALSSEIELNVIKPNGKKNLLKVKSERARAFFAIALESFRRTLMILHRAFLLARMKKRKSLGSYWLARKKHRVYSRMRARAEGRKACSPPNHS
jgi:hypothetical protein